MLTARIICAASALICLVVGVWSLLDPAGVAASVGYSFASPAGRIELAAVYGGFYTGVGLFLAWATRRADWLVPALAMSTLGAAATFIARLAGATMLGATPGLTMSLLASEVLWSLASAVGWYLAARSR
jgi:hypothetical protein